MAHPQCSLAQVIEEELGRVGVIGGRVDADGEFRGDLMPNFIITSKAVGY
jgi:hypothetical protein